MEQQNYLNNNAVGGTLGDKAPHMGDALRDHLPSKSDAKQWMSGHLDTIKGGVTQASDFTDRFVRESPYIALACGLVTGLIGGYFLSCALNKE